jgi:hypothetical protein
MSDDFVKKDFTPEDVTWHNKEEALLEEMGLTRNDTEKLRKTMLSADEAVCAKSEELTAIRQHKGRRPNWQEFVDSVARMGRVLPGNEVVRRLRTILPQLRVHDGRVRGTWSLFSPIIKTFEDGFHSGWEYIGWCYSDWNPEYQVDYCDEDGVPKGNRQGYRTLLLRNITKMDGTGRWTLKAKGIVLDGTGLPLKIITEVSALKAFGYPSGGQGRDSYLRQLYDFRHGIKSNPAKWF